jgi:membrane protein YqaA with SNARE-associated domain
MLGLPRMMQLVSIWALFALAFLGALVLVQSRRAGGYARWQRRNWRSLIVASIIFGALPAFVLDYFSARNVDLPPELQRRPSIVEKSN